jgi:hypothetical protein
MDKAGVDSGLTIRVDNAPTLGAFPVSINDIALGQLMTDDRGRGQLSIRNGETSHDLSEFAGLSVDLELAIGDIVKGKLAKSQKK